MGYNSENFKKVKEIYENKYKTASQNALQRKQELWLKIPGVKDLDDAITEIGLQAVYSSIGGGEGAKEKILSLKEKSLKLQEQRAMLLEENGYPRDYSDIAYECEKCLDSGYVDTKMCDCMKRALVLAGYESSGLGKLMTTQSFSNFSLDYYRTNPDVYEKMRHNFEYMKRFADEFSTSKCSNIALFGSTGLGKTHLSTAAAKVIINKGYDVLYVTAVGMIADFEKERFGSGYSDTAVSSLERYYDCDLLIIDDVGTEVSNQFTVSVIYNVINNRLSKGRSTVISTNLTPSELRSRYWDRIASRIFGEYAPLVFSGTDVRLQKLKNAK